ncbi:hypothetical protein DCS_08215 [Drechmeria coniospora]|uniref:Uncharacterized protein n=1 Tax=Drechmeria coniospora TaxID=98403 RepID=A0A151GGM7_DRECN|nr:hypothetical protein DCS_08215 [Drechmeria coniospora]KYK56245.1 hypothetical protein DCS_08215 [Drechmeria coniospora]
MAISVRTRIAPLLLRMVWDGNPLVWNGNPLVWDGNPLVWSDKYGWVFAVPPTPVLPGQGVSTRLTPDILTSGTWHHRL